MCIERPETPPPPQCTKSVYKVKVRVTVSYLTSVAKQAKTAFLHGPTKSALSLPYQRNSQADMSMHCGSKDRKILRFLLRNFFSKKKVMDFTQWQCILTGKRHWNISANHPSPSCGFFFVSFHHQASRNSSVGRALDWRSKGPWFNPGFRQFFFLFFPFMFSSFYGTKARDTKFTHPVPCFG